MLVLLAVVNVLLIRQNLQMRGRLDQLKPKTLQPGDQVPSFSAQGLHGEMINVDYAGETRRVLLYFSATCPYCQEQFPYWRELLQRVNGNHFQVLGLVSESEDKTKLDEFLHSIGCESLHVAFVPNDLLRSYKLSMTPTTLVVLKEGKVEKAWAGRWNSEALAAASSTFGFSFSQP
jgi:hypothetical protein